MSTGLNVEIVPSELEQIVESVFENMLGLKAEPCAMPWFPGADRLTAAVHLIGAWSGAVLVECDGGQACRFTGRYLLQNSPAAVDDVVRDTLGELANMIGGNLKCVLRPGIQLSMPVVMDGSEYHQRVSGGEVRERLAFECGEGPFWVTVLAMQPGCAT